jgi:hypothetical protein
MEKRIWKVGNGELGMGSEEWEIENEEWLETNPPLPTLHSPL